MKLGMILLGLLFSAVVQAAPPPASSPEARIRATFEKQLGGKVAHVVKTAYPNIYEVQWEGQLFYTDAKAQFFMVGAMFDMQTQRNLTQESLNRLSALAWKDIPLHWAMKQIKGKGSRKLAVFEDPYCGYCKLLRKHFEHLEDVTIYTFLYPVITEESLPTSISIWCASDPVKTWDDWMLRGVKPAAANCEHPIQNVLQFGMKTRVTGTPTLFFPDGTRASGAIPLVDLQEKLSKQGKDAPSQP